MADGIRRRGPLIAGGVALAALVVGIVVVASTAGQDDPVATQDSSTTAATTQGSQASEEPAATSAPKSAEPTAPTESVKRPDPGPLPTVLPNTEEGATTFAIRMLDARIAGDGQTFWLGLDAASQTRYTAENVTALLTKEKFTYANAGVRRTLSTKAELRYVLVSEDKRRQQKDAILRHDGVTWRWEVLPGAVL